MVAKRANIGLSNAVKMERVWISIKHSIPPTHIQARNTVANYYTDLRLRPTDRATIFNIIRTHHETKSMNTFIFPWKTTIKI